MSFRAPETPKAPSVCASMSIASSKTSSARSNGQDVLYSLQERVDVKVGDRLLASKGMRELRLESEGYWQSICNLVCVAKTLGGFIPVDYSRPSSCPDYYGRMKATCCVDGVPCTPYVRLVRQARAILAGAYYTDVDMVNCQPSIMSQKLRILDIPCPLLDHYVSDREKCIQEVVSSCKVDRDAAKNLFIRLVYFGGVTIWAKEHGVDKANIPTWINELKDEIRSNAKWLLSLPELLDFTKSFDIWSKNVNGLDLEMKEAKNNEIATKLSVFLQSAECDCVRALVDAIQSDSRIVGSIICDGVLVENSDSLGPVTPTCLQRWSSAIFRKTGLRIQLSIKSMVVDEKWLTPTEDEDRDTWMSGHLLLTYEEMKVLWERHTFKIIKTAIYVRESSNDSRDIFSDKMIFDSYKHLHYAVFDSKNSKINVSRQCFISRWIKDPCIRSFYQIALAPPPMTVSRNTYNIWNGFAVERYVDVHQCSSMNSEAVRTFLDFVDVLFGRRPEDVKYFLDWTAHIFQKPSIKNEIAVLLVGCEGAGKNRLTDLLRLMMGPDRFFQTANPSTTLYGRFNNTREGKLLIVINESSGKDNFAASDLIKDMITCPEFVCEGKNTNAYSIACFARFIFTTNNDNCLKISHDSRRFFVKEVSSALKGDHEYFKKLSLLIDDPLARYEFYKFLMARDIEGIDWINSRPMTEYMLSMIDANQPFECQFLKDLVVEHRNSTTNSTSNSITNSTTNSTKSIRMDVLFEDFRDWATRKNQTLTAMNSTKLGMKISRLIWSPTGNTLGFKGISKSRNTAGSVYTFDMSLLSREMVEKQWLDSSFLDM